jgi:hypothetical protein
VVVDFIDKSRRSNSVEAPPADWEGVRLALDSKPQRAISMRLDH